MPSAMANHGPIGESSQAEVSTVATGITDGTVRGLEAGCGLSL